MFINITILMELHKSREAELVLRAESSRIQTHGETSQLTLRKRFMHTIANTLVLLGLR